MKNNSVSTLASKDEAKSKKSKRTTNLKVAALFAGVILFLGTGLLFLSKGKDSFNPISIVSTVSASTLNQTDGRTNILLLGSDKRTDGQIQSVLTDTIMVASIGKVDKNVVIVSLPRDLWVESPRGYKAKINEIYAYSEAYEKGSGSKEITQVVESVLGIPVHYYGTVDFDVFKQSIDALDGIDITVETAFEDFDYPVEGKETAPDSERYQTISFNAGLQKMDGETALKYARSRHGTNGEDSDFARSRRQQNIIIAVKNKVLSLGTLLDPTKLFDLYKAYSQNIDTNISLGDIQAFYLLAQQIDLSKVKTVVIDDRSTADNGGLLYAPTDRSLYEDKYVLIPRVGDFSQLHAYVKKYIFGEQ